MSSQSREEQPVQEDGVMSAEDERGKTDATGYQRLWTKGFVNMVALRFCSATILNTYAATVALYAMACFGADEAMAGIAVGNWWMPGFPLPVVLVGALAVALACRHWPLAQSIAIYLCCMVTGMALMQLQHDREGQRWGCELEAVVMSEPAERPKTIGVDLLVPQAGGRTLRCYLWKDERSRALRLGDELVVCSHANDTRAGTGAAPIFARNGDWHPGGTALSQLSRWQRSRLWFLKQRHKLLSRAHRPAPPCTARSTP